MKYAHSALSIRPAAWLGCVAVLGPVSVRGPNFGEAQEDDAEEFIRTAPL